MYETYELYLKIAESYTSTLLAGAEARARLALDWIDQARLLTPFGAKVIIVVVALLMMWTIQLWLRHREIGRVKTACASFAPVIFFAMLLSIPSGFAGSPDENCSKYEDGKLTYVLLTFIAVPKVADDFYGEGWIVLIVQAKKRWGDDTHQCRLSLDDPKVKLLQKILTRLQGDFSSGYSRGNVTFTFGGKDETPNVSIPPLQDEKKNAPPERPKPKQDI